MDFKCQAAAAALFAAFLIAPLAACKGVGEKDASAAETQVVKRGYTTYKIPAGKDSDTVAEVRLQGMSLEQARTRLLESMQKDGYAAIETKRRRLVFEKRACEPGPADLAERMSSKDIPSCDDPWLYIISDITAEGPLRRVRFDLARKDGEVQVIVDAHYSFPEDPSIPPFRASDDELLGTWRMRVLAVEPLKSRFGLAYFLVGPGWAKAKGLTETAAQLEAAKSSALNVQEIDKGGPAEAARLAKDDLITAIDGAPIHDPFQMLLMTRRLPPGRELLLTIRRADKEEERTLILAAPPGGETGAEN